MDLSGIGGSEKGRLQTQAEIYASALRAGLRSGICKRFGFWDIGDQYSWLVVYANKPRTAEARLFDDSLNPKPAYFALLRVMLDELR